MDAITSIRTVAPVAPLSPSGASEAAGTSGFGAALSDAMRNVEAVNATADQLTGKFVAGETVDLHNVALATQKATLQFEMFLQVRNKIVQAYQEVMRLQL